MMHIMILSRNAIKNEFLGREWREVEPGAIAVVWVNKKPNMCIMYGMNKQTSMVRSMLLLFLCESNLMFR